MPAYKLVLIRFNTTLCDIRKFNGIFRSVLLTTLKMMTWVDLEIEFLRQRLAKRKSSQYIGFQCSSIYQM